jgi:hypothetical protein
MLLNSNRILVGLFVIFFGLRCSKERAYLPDNLPTLLFVNAQIDPNLGVNILVSRAVSTSDTVYIRDLLVNDATIELINENGNRINVPFKNDGKYFLDTLGLNIEAGKKYKLETRVLGLPNVESEWVTIPEMVSPDTIGFALDGGFNGDNPTGKGYLQFKPRSTPTNYLLRMSGINDNLPPFRVGFGLEITQLCDIYLRAGDACFDNTCFGGNTTAKCIINADASRYLPITNENLSFKSIEFQFGSVSKEYQEYLFSLEQPEEWENGLVEPKPTYTNISGGWGVFFASNTSTWRIEL